jgi:hypothetical protein
VVVDQWGWESTVADLAEVGETDAEVPVSRASKCLVEPAGREKQAQPDEQVGPLDAWIPSQEVRCGEPLRRCVDEVFAFHALDAAQVCRDHVELPLRWRYRLMDRDGVLFGDSYAPKAGPVALL